MLWGLSVIDAEVVVLPSSSLSWTGLCLVGEGLLGGMVLWVLRLLVSSCADVKVTLSLAVDIDIPSVVLALMTVDSAICSDGLDGVSVITAVLVTFSMMSVGVMMSSVFDFVALGFDVELWTAVDFPLVETSFSVVEGTVSAVDDADAEVEDSLLLFSVDADDTISVCVTATVVWG